MTVFSACGSTNLNSGTNTNNAASQHEGESSASGEKTELVFWTYYETDAQKNMVKKLVDGFNASQPDIVVTDQYVPYADFTKQLSIGLAAQNLPDVITINNPDMASYAKMGLFADVTDLLKDWKDKDQYFPGPWASTVYDGKSYGIPFVSNDLALYYNEDMLTAAGIKPPTTWNELKEAAKVLTTADTAGFGMSAVNREEGTFQFTPFLYSAGGTYKDLGSQGAINALSLLTDMMQDGSMSKEVINWGQSDVAKQFIVGKIAMMVNGPWQMPTIESSAPDLNYGVVPLPKPEGGESISCLGGENLGVINNENAEASVKFLMYIAQPEVMKQYSLDYGAFPPRADVAADEAFTGNPKNQVFLNALTNAVPRGPEPQWPQYSKAIYTAVQESLTGAKAPEQAAKDAQAAIDQIN
jgi:multiple sugar transport system substrate-binding protein